MVVKKWARKWLMLFAVTPFPGCATFQDLHYEHTQKLRTECAYWNYKWTCDSPMSSDYSKGWKAGYLNVLTGGDGQPPLVPPHCYWKPSQITKHGDQKRQEWYLGYQDGAMMASLEPDTHFIKTWTPPASVRPGYYEYSESPAAVPESPPKVPPSESPGESASQNWNPTAPGLTPSQVPNLPPAPTEPERLP